MDLVCAEKNIKRAWVLSTIGLTALLIEAFLYASFGVFLINALELFLPWWFPFKLTPRSYLAYSFYPFAILFTFMVYRKSRIGAILLFISYIVTRLMVIMLAPTGWSGWFIWWCLTIFWGFFLFQGTRGTFAYHRLKSVAAPSGPREA